ncbi:hypothetical protein EYF80_002963 [Liparis tanakae]|uniref:Uncharacterized protein n=1 Tax=Liparis tanakae TaxID=230148 RepID=A0A4Z2J9J1_9TELE|nr:hypothetical protein EYF80_002963 [Liparis tanakae]
MSNEDSNQVERYCNMLATPGHRQNKVILMGSVRGMPESNTSFATLHCNGTAANCSRLIN